MMLTPSLSIGVATLLSFVSDTRAVPSEVKPPAFFLAGDSTTAVQAVINGGGWGDGFLNTTLKHCAAGKNYGHNGATTVSFRAGGDWAAVLKSAASSTQKHTPYITIQFGHNDQKPEKNISMAQLTANLVAFVEEVRTVNAVPILVTSLSRRGFTNSTSPPSVKENLADVTAATKEAAKRTGAHIIDLNAASTWYLNQIGPDRAAEYNLSPADFTHLNKEGSVVFGNQVAILIREEIPELKRWVVPVKKIESSLRKGVFIFPKL